MKAIIRITGVILVSLILISLWVMFSSFKQRDGIQIRKQIMHEIIAYAEKQIVPVIQPLRENVDKELSSSDRMEITAAREQLRKIRDIRMSAGLMPMEIAESNRELTDEELRLVKETRKQFRKEIMKVWEIADRNEDIISRELALAKPYFETWKEDVRNMTKEQLPFSLSNFIPSSKIALFKQLGLAEELLPVVFLLYNPDIPLSQLEAVLDNADDQSTGIKIYPNPAHLECCFEIDLAETGEVKISLYDRDGNFLDEPFSGQMKKGIHNECISLNGFPRGLAFAVFSIDDRKIMKSIIIE